VRGLGLSGIVGTPEDFGLGLSGIVGTPEPFGLGLSGIVGTPDDFGLGLSGIVGTPLANEIAKFVAATARTVIPIARNLLAVRDMV
jgi:hypothetical protein